MAAVFLRNGGGDELIDGHIVAGSRLPNLGMQRVWQSQAEAAHGVSSN
jgi:hypothetical protein